MFVHSEVADNNSSYPSNYTVFFLYSGLIFTMDFLHFCMIFINSHICRLNLKDEGIRVMYNVPYNVDRKSRILGECFADLLVEDKIIIEVKDFRKLNDEHIRLLAFCI